MHCQWGSLSSLFFVPGDLDHWPLTLTFELWRDLCTMHLTAKFHHPTLNRSEVIVHTSKQTYWQTDRRRWKHPPRFARLRRWVNSNRITGIHVGRKIKIVTYTRKTRSTGTVHTSAKARLTSVATRIRIPIRDRDRNQNLTLIIGPLSIFLENFMQIRSEVYA